MKTIFNFSGALALSLLGVFSIVSVAKADVLVSVGYYDLTPSYGNPNPVPNPWYGSPNTTFFGSVSEATSSDPDESAILLTNTGTSAVTLSQGFTVGGYKLWDSYIGAGGFSLLPGTGLILSGTSANSFDGSDIPLTDSTISLTLNGSSYSLVDSNSILAGFPAYDETEPWTQIGDLLHTSTTATPEPMTFGLVGLALVTVGTVVRRRKS